jgi:WD40 repeat protein
MPISLPCPHCGAGLTIPESALGKKGRCPKCQESFVAEPPTDDQDAVATLTGGLVEEPEDEGDEERDDTQGDTYHVPGVQAAAGKLGRFELRAALGQGGFGMVYRAYDPVLDREVALKVPKFGADQPKRIERFLREAKAAAGLRHPNIVAVYESGKAGDDWFIASEFVVGLPLSVRLKQKPPSLRQAVRWVRDLARALAYAHGEGIVHRDIKPANIMIGKKGRPQLMDFGLAKRLDEIDWPLPPNSDNQGQSPDLTREGSVLGTPAYMAPEQARGDTRAVGPKSDQYSLGVVIYEMLTGKKPFDGPAAVVLARVIRDEPKPPRRIQPKLSRDLEAICLKSMAKEPKKRYADCTELADDLDNWLRGEPVSAYRTGPVGSLWRWCRRRPALSIASGLALAALVTTAVLGVYFALYKSQVASDLAEKQHQTEEALAKANTESERAARESRQTQLAMGKLFREQGVRQCEQRNLGLGMLLLARGHEIAAGLRDDPLRHELAVNLSIFSGQLAPLRSVLDLGQLDADNAISLAADGKTVLTGSRYRGHLWDLTTGKLLGQPLEHEGRIATVALSPDGKTALIADSMKTTQLWDVAGEKPRASIGCGQITCAVFSPDSQTLATASGKTVRRWEAATGKEVLPSREAGETVNALAFRPDGNWLAAASDDKTVHLWNLADTKKTMSLPHSEPVAALAFSADGQMIVTAAGRFARLWDFAKGRSIGPRYEHMVPVKAVAFAPDNATFLGASGNTVQLWHWDAAQEYGRALGQPLTTGASVQMAVFGEGGQSVLAFDGRAIRIWDVSGIGRLHRVWKHDLEVSRLDFSPDGRTILTTGFNNAWLRSAATGQSIGPPIKHESNIDGAVFSPDGRTLLTVANEQLRAWRTVNGLPLPQFANFQARLNHMQFDEAPNAVFRPDSQAFLTIGYDDVRQWDLRTGSMIGNPLKHPHVRAAAYAGGGSVILTWNNDEVRRWDANGAPLGAPLAGAKYGNNVVLLSPNRQVLLLTVQDGTRLWNALTGDPIGPVLPEKAGVAKAVFSADSQAVLTIHRATARLWNTKTGQAMSEALPLKVSSSELVDRLALSPDRQRFVYSTGYSARLRNLAAEPVEDKLLTTGEHIGVLAYASDGRTILIGSNSAARLFDAATGRPIGLPMEHGDGIRSAVFSPDGQTILTCSGKEARLWPVPRWIGDVDTAEQVTRSVKVLTGMELDADGILRPLDAAAWHEQRRRLGND